MPQTGFFTRSALKVGSETKSKSISSGFSAERLNQLGLVGVENMNPSAKTKHMAPSGPENPIIYILGEAPGEQEDEEGVPFVGKSGSYLRRIIGREWMEKCRVSNCVRTRPPNNRKPEFHEVECYRNSVEEDIERTKPWAILGCGGVPLSWAFDDVGGIYNCRGRKFPIKVGSHRCWYFPVMHPSHILRMRDDDKGGDIPADEWEECFKRDICRVFEEAREVAAIMEADEQGVIQAPLVDLPNFLEPEEMLKRIICLEGNPGDLRTIKAFLASITTAAGIDIETNCKRPYESGRKILSIAISTREQGIAFAWDHPQARWSKPERQELSVIIRDFLVRSGRKVAHSLSFELEWFLAELGEEVIWSDWDDTMVQAYHLDPPRDDEKKNRDKVTGQSLDFLCLLNFGVKLKDFSKAVPIHGLFGAFGGAEKIDRSQLERTNLADVLKYNGLDAIYTIHLSAVQRRRLGLAGMLDRLRHHLLRVPALVIAQMIGMPVNQTQVRYYQNRLKNEISGLSNEIMAMPEVKQFQASFGVYDPGSTKDFTRLLRDVMKLEEGKVQGGRYSTDKKVLIKVKDKPVIKATLHLRELAKLKSTYVDPLDISMKDSIVFPDGKIHCLFNNTRTVTVRLSSDSPNMQNFPKRRDAHIRSCIYSGN